MNMNNLMQQAQRMQKDIENKQKEINSMKFTGVSELVEITLNGDKSVDKVSFKNVNSLDSDDIECLEDMIKIAFNDALNQIEKETEKKMGMYSKMAGGLF